MRDPERIEPMIELLSSVWTAHPDLRLGQLIVAAHSLSGFPGDVFNVEDEDLALGMVNMVRVES